MAVFKRYRKQKDGSKVPYWYIRYWVNGEEKWEAVGKVGEVTKGVAQKALEDRKRMIRLGQWDMIGATIPTLSEFAEDYIRYVRDIKGNRSWGSALYHLRHLKDFFGNRKLSQITSKDIDDYKLARLQEVKPATVNRKLACLSCMFNLAKRQKEFFGNNPVAESKLLPENNQVERILTPEEEERPLKCSSPFLRPILICALNTGMRKGEILTLQRSNVDLVNNVITLEHTNTKNKKMRRIPISSTLRKTFLEQRLKGGGSEFVFLSSNGNPYKRHDSLKQAFEGACRRANIQGLRFHDLRHTAATRMVEEGVGIDKVSKILGHSTLNMTMRYSHPDDSLKDAVEKLGNYTLNRSQETLED